MEFRFGSLTFTSKFDSGNLANVEKVSKDEEDNETCTVGPPLSTPNSSTVEIKPDFEFNVWTKPDCDGTPYVNGNRSWFYFGVRGSQAGKLIKINIVNMNRQGRLFSQGHMPMVRTIPGRPKWDRIKDRPTFETVNGNFILSFTHRFFENRSSVTYFAFSYPWPYDTCQERLKELDEKFKNSYLLSSKSDKSSIYYHRELLCYSLERLRIDLITISDCHGIQDEEEPRFDDLLFPDRESSRCKGYVGKKVYVVSSRVHPGETPGSFVFNGFLDFVLREDDPRAKQLRKQYVFKLIPMLNPDGVAQGHYRTDTRGVNLNRVYLDPSFELYPSIYAAKSLLVYYHIWSSNIPDDEKELIAASLWSTPASTSKMEKDNDVCKAPLDDSLALSLSETSEALHDPNFDSVMPRKFFFGAAESFDKSESQPARSLFDVLDDGKVKFDYLNGVSSSSSSVTTGMDLAWRNFSLATALFNSHPITDAAVSTLESKDCCGSVSNDNLDNCNACVSNEYPEISAIRIDEDIQKRDSFPSSVDLNDIPSGGECEDFDDSIRQGNEGSDEEGDDKTPVISSVLNTPHLCHPKLLSISPHSSGIAYYVDLHGHASKRGCFVYGNYFESEEMQVENMLFARLIALNSAHFDFGGCNFTEKNMYMVDKKDGSSKEGSGRVAAFKALGIIHSYTLECNYNTGRLVNIVPQASGDDGKATPPPIAGIPPKYTPAHYEDVGKAMALAALDMTDSNPWSRIPGSDYQSLFGLKEQLRKYLQSLRTPAKTLLSRTTKTTWKNSSQVSSSLPRVALLAKNSTSNLTQPQVNESNNANSVAFSSAVYKDPNHSETRKLTSTAKKKEPNFVKEASSLTVSRQLRQKHAVNFTNVSFVDLVTNIPTCQARQPLSAIASRRPPKYTEIMLQPLSLPVTTWSSSLSSGCPPKRQSSAELSSKLSSTSSLSSRALQFQQPVVRHSEISKSLSSDSVCVPKVSCNTTTMQKSFCQLSLTGTATSMDVVCDSSPAADVTPTAIVSTPVSRLPCLAAMDILNSALETCVPSREPGCASEITGNHSLEAVHFTGADGNEPNDSITDEAILLSTKTWKRSEDTKLRASVPLQRPSLLKMSDVKRSSLHEETSKTQGNVTELTRGKVFRGKKPFASQLRSLSLVSSNSRSSPNGSKTFKQKSRVSVEKKS